MLEIREYKLSDHADVWNLHRLALKETGALLDDDSLDDDLNHIGAVYLNRGGTFLVGTLAGIVVAMGALRKTSATHAEIRRMRVHPHCQRCGYGQAILDALQTRAHQLGYTVLRLDTTTLQVAAQQFYEKNGFRETGRKQIHHFTAIFYEKTIRSSSTP
jgi:ribosomal protein S18 acetylase RimI-like enzyme